MFFLLSKILVYGIQPISWIFVLLLFSVCLPKWRKKALIFSLLLLFIFGNQPLFDFINLKWQIARPSLEELKSTAPKTAIVLGGATLTGRQPYRLTSFNQAADRITQAVQLYRMGVIDHIIFTGGNGHLQKIEGEPSEAAQSLQFLLDCNIPRSAILLEDQSRNTFENALLTKKIIDQHASFKHKDYLLITSAFHMRRSVACFKKQNINTVPFSVHYLTSDRDFMVQEYVLPNAETLTQWNMIIKEWIGFVAYKVKGYV